MQDAILFHELIHVERRDWLFTVGEEVIRAVFWFHPAMWWLVSGPSFARLMIVELWFAFFYASYNGAMAVFLTEIMPAEMRISGFRID